MVRDRADRDDVPFAHAHQVGQEGAGHEKRRHDVDRELLLELFRRRVDQGLQEEGAGIVHHDARNTDALQHTPDGAADLIGNGDVAAQIEEPVVTIGESAREPHDTCSRSLEGFGDGQSDATTGARDERRARERAHSSQLPPWARRRNSSRVLPS